MNLINIFSNKGNGKLSKKDLKTLQRLNDRLFENDSHNLRLQFSDLYKQFSGIVRDDIDNGLLPPVIGGKPSYSYRFRVLKTSLGLSADLKVDDMTPIQLYLVVKKLTLYIEIRNLGYSDSVAMTRNL